MPKYPRIIVNSRYCRVARSGEQTDGKNIVSGFAMENLVQYVGTREGVVFNQANGLNLPVTEKQTSFIQKLLDNCPDITNLIEYADYQEASTRLTPPRSFPLVPKCCCFKANLLIRKPLKP